MKSLAVIVPTRNRPHAIPDFMQDWRENTSLADAYFVLDRWDLKRFNYQRIKDLNFMVSPKSGMVASLNWAAMQLSLNYSILGFMGDDNRVKTPGWDSAVISALEDQEIGIAYGNDLLRGALLPSSVFLTQPLVMAMNGFSPVQFQHLYVDNFWLKLGNDLEKIHYLENVIIEHLHPAARKAKVDRGYRKVNAKSVYKNDRELYEAFLASPEYSDLLKRLKIL
jgi:hypothetical protein